MINSEYSFFILLSNDKTTIKNIAELIEDDNKKRKSLIIIFDNNKTLIKKKNFVYVNQIDWMNRIISHGINSKIFKLQLIRDMEFYYE